MKVRDGIKLAGDRQSLSERADRTDFDGAGQKTDVYVYTTHVGSHVGGYDSWNVDITDAVKAFLGSKMRNVSKGKYLCRSVAIIHVIWK